MTNRRNMLPQSPKKKKKNFFSKSTLPFIVLRTESSCSYISSSTCSLGIRLLRWNQAGCQCFNFRRILPAFRTSVYWGRPRPIKMTSYAPSNLPITCNPNCKTLQRASLCCCRDTSPASLSVSDCQRRAEDIGWGMENKYREGDEEIESNRDNNYLT